jgi:hypothetical protein
MDCPKHLGLCYIRCKIFLVIAGGFKKICLLKLRVKFGRFLDRIFPQVGMEKIPSPYFVNLSFLFELRTDAQKS